jgi:assimilatory nitrate reductase catalytic subunit
VVISSDQERIISVRGDPDHPANFGRLCTKGETLHLSARSDFRALHPELRRDRNEPRSKVSWEDAFECAAELAQPVVSIVETVTGPNQLAPRRAER